jgi:hypothetical protein
MGFYDSKYNKKWVDFMENEEVKKQIELLMDGQSLIFFFKKDNDIYGSGEDGRLTFARMKNPTEDGKDWKKEANFMAINLSRTLKGEKVHNIFASKDLNKIKVLDKDDALSELAKKARGKVEADKIEPKDDNDPETSQGQVQLKGGK